ncbi:ATP-dependent helicase HrpB, partial [Myxococcota bacterium]|nr:ATP-dependent helicase HrpB [Myxococcota bacterium]
GELLVAIDVDGGARGQRDAALVRVASQVERAWLAEDTHGLVEEKKVRWNAQREAAESVLVVRYQDLVLEERIAEPGDPDALAAALLEAALEQPERALPLSEGAEQLLLRLRFLRRARPNLELDWVDGDVRRALIPDLVEGRRSFADLQKVSVAGAIRNHLAHDVARALEADAPERLEVPSGRKVELRYEVDGPPVLSVRLQEVFGMHETPKVGGGRVPVKMELLAPNQRPVQVTQDLRSFWANTYAEVRNELRRRYPKHQWPEDPRDGDPTKKPGRR